MKNLFEKSAEQAAKSVHLSAHEKAAMRVELVKCMERTPVRRNIFSVFGSFSFPNPLALLKNPMPVFALLLALSIGAGTTYASESALPGDVLYPVKIHVAEELRALVAVNDEARAQWEVERANRRLEEASRLAVRGSLNTQAQAVVESNFTQFAERAQQRIEKLKTAGNVDAAVEVSSRFESALRAHEEIFERLQKKERRIQVTAKNTESNSPVHVDLLIKDVGRQVQNISTAREAFEIKPKERTQNSVLEKRNGLRTQLRELRAYIELRSNVISDESRSHIGASLTAVENLLKNSDARLNAGENIDAFSSLQAAARELDKTRLMVRSLVELSLDVPVKQNDDSDDNGRDRSEQDDRSERREDREQKEQDKPEGLREGLKGGLNIRGEGALRVKLGR